MSHHCHLQVIKTSPDFRFGPLADLNAALRASPGVGQLVDDDGTDFVQVDGAGGIAFWDRESLRFQRRANVYGCVGSYELAVIATHVAQGSLLICMEQEAGPELEFWLLRRGWVEAYTFPLPP